MAIKRGLLLFIQQLAASVFIGIAVYGAILYWGGETQKKIPVSQSLFLGLGAVICIVVIVAVGGLQDQIASSSEERSDPERKDNG